MRDDVKVCVSARVDFFSKYYDIPQSVQTEVDAFISDTEALGERCTDAQQFEAEFVSSGLCNRFNAILPNCTPKAMSSSGVFLLLIPFFVATLRSRNISICQQPLFSSVAF